MPVVEVFVFNRRYSMKSDINHIQKLAYSIREACSVSSLGRTTLYAHIAAGRLRVTRIGGRTLIPAEALHALINGRTQ
tara:strand:- start:7768 stop:8001 length:234 start_codon:yes stop_codon:yes gene_type:complete